MRVFVSHPLDTIQIDTVIVLQDAANPRNGRDGIGAYADTVTIEIGRSEPAALGVVDEKWMRQHADYDSGKQHERLTMCLGLQESDNCQLGNVILQMAHNIFESRARHFHIGEVEDDTG